jgi:hypothetical protein
MNFQITWNVKTFLSSRANMSLSRTAPWNCRKIYLNFSFLIIICIFTPVMAFYINKNNFNLTVKSQSCRTDAR